MTTEQNKSPTQQHTPGPWTLGAYAGGKEPARWFIVSSDRQPESLGAPCKPVFVVRELDCEYEDVLLMVAAPELLEALVQIERLLRGSPCAAAHSVACDAIAKTRVPQ